MTTLVTDNCQRCRFTECVTACPVSAFHAGEDMLYINPDVCVDCGAFTILMFLIKNNSASKTVSIFFLIPATSAFMAWLFLNESLTNIDLLGFLITTIGVYIATRD